MTPWFKPTASAVTVIDNFEDGDLSEYGGDTAEAGIQSTYTKDGLYGVEINQSGSSYQEIRSTSGLPYYPSQGDTFRVWLRIGDINTTFVFGAQAESNRDDQYLVMFHEDNNDLSIKKRSGGSESTLASDSVTLSAETPYEAEIDWATDGTITATAYDDSGSQLATVSSTDNDYTTGGIGWGSYGTPSYGDFARVV